MPGGNSLPAALLLPLAATVAVEGLLALLLFRQWRLVYYTFLCNLLTNPAVNLLLILAMNAWGREVYTPLVVVLELVALMVEAAVYNYLTEFGGKKCFLLSLLLNAASYLTGLIFL